MKKLTAAFLVLAFILAPVLAAAQTGGAGGTQKPGTSPSTSPGTSPRPPGTGTPGDPAASPRGGSDTMSQHTTKAACEKAGGMWTESTKSCKAK